MCTRHCRRFAGLAPLLAALVVASGCAPSTTGQRPVVTETAVEAAGRAGAPSTDARALNFFDELEARPLAAHDDVLTGGLILATGQPGPGFEERVRAAKVLGYMEPGYNPPAREAATLGEVAQFLMRVARRGERVSIQEAMAEMVTRGAVPPGARSFQGLTGAQLVSMLGAASDAMSSAGVGKQAWPIQPETPPAPPGTPAVDPASESAPRSADHAPSAHMNAAEAPSSLGHGLPGEMEPGMAIPVTAVSTQAAPDRHQIQSVPAVASAPAAPNAVTPSVPVLTPAPVESATVPPAASKAKAGSKWVAAKPIKPSEPTKSASGGQ